MSLKAEDKLINAIDIDHFGSAVERLGTTGVRPCVGIIVIADNNQCLFIEYRSDAYLPAVINLNNIHLCFENTATHISEVYYLILRLCKLTKQGF